MVRSGAVKTILRLFAVLLTALLALVLVRQTAFAKTYVITDGDRVVTYTTFAPDPAVGAFGLHEQGVAKGFDPVELAARSSLLLKRQRRWSSPAR